MIINLYKYGRTEDEDNIDQDNIDQLNTCYIYIKTMSKLCIACHNIFQAHCDHHIRCQPCQAAWYTETYDSGKSCLGCEFKPMRKDKDYCQDCEHSPEYQCEFCQRTYRSCLRRASVLCILCIGRQYVSQSPVPCGPGPHVIVTYRTVVQPTEQIECHQTGEPFNVSIVSITVKMPLIDLTIEDFDGDNNLKDMKHPSVKLYIREYQSVCVTPYSIYADPVGPEIYLLPTKIQLVMSDTE